MRATEKRGVGAMKARRRWWRRRGWIAGLVGLSAILMCLNLLGGRSPLKMAALAAARPLLALLGEVDPPSLEPGNAHSSGTELESLRAKNARLDYEIHRLRDLLSASSRTNFDSKRYAFRALPAQVLCRAGVPGLRHAVLVDRGRIDGIRKGMGVVSGDRAVGRIHRVGEEMSLVLLVTDPACKVRATFLAEEGVKEESNDAGEGPAGLPAFEGICEGDLERDGGIRLKHLPRHADIESGCAVVTTGWAGHFPPGMAVGWAESVEEELDGLFLDVLVKPALAGEPLRSVMILLPALDREWESEVRAGNR
jgi:rod shape-determining protein MreC